MTQCIQKRRSVALLIMILFLLATLPWSAVVSAAGSPPKGSDYTTNKTIAQRLDKVFATYGPGTYFTYNGKGCTDHGADNNGCSANLGPNVRDCNCRRVLDDGTDMLASQCFGFARYVFYTCFGFIDHAGVSAGKYYSLGSIGAGLMTEANVKSMLLKAKAGAHIRLEGHSMAVLSVDANGITVIHANVDNQCGVVLQSFTWAKFVQTYQWRGIEFVNMPKTYPGDGGTTPTPTLPAVTTKNVAEGIYTLQNVSTGRMLQVSGGKDADETPVTTGAAVSGSKAQQFKLGYKDNGRYYLRAMCSSSGGNRVLDVIKGSDGRPSSGDLLEIYRPVDEDAQLFRLVPLSDGTYAVEVAAAKNVVVADPQVAGKQVVLQTYTGAALQKWRLTRVDGTPVPNEKIGVYTVKVDEGSVLNLRGAANTSSDIKATIPNKTLLPVTKTSGTWGYTTYKGMSGWVSLEYVTRTRAFGDLNNNGKIEAVDALTALQGATQKITLTAVEKMTADINGDGKVTASDALSILQYVTKKIQTLV